MTTHKHACTKPPQIHRCARAHTPHAAWPRQARLLRSTGRRAHEEARARDEVEARYKPRNLKCV
eukprot:6192614-Pleurochrysis_carterae.AAC.1